MKNTAKKWDLKEKSNKINYLKHFFLNCGCYRFWSVTCHGPYWPFTNNFWQIWSLETTQKYSCCTLTEEKELHQLDKKEEKVISGRRWTRSCTKWNCRQQLAKTSPNPPPSLHWNQLSTGRGSPESSQSLHPWTSSNFHGKKANTFGDWRYQDWYKHSRRCLAAEGWTTRSL